MISSDGIKSKGYTIKGRLSFIDTEFGECEREKVFALLDDDIRDILSRRVISSDWYPLKYQVNLSMAIDKALGKGDLELCRKIGKFTAESDLNTIHKIILKMGSPQRLLKLSAGMWSRYYSEGSLVLESIGNGYAVALVKDFNPISKAFCTDLSGWMIRTLELTGATNVDLNHTKCVLDGDEACRYEATWKY
ncbi:MAG TPA: hypothetical protein PK014_14245 [Thermoanaerobaculia bacterium]|nr:hypothetical protein [Thermoanaerobaculia bacterium]HUM31136.1 hypothetical protein [Thermoanaerobaculia bacterium]HXK69492.1 hypothetical protein [Thermoanaerobaculia bacterium]